MTRAEQALLGGCHPRQAHNLYVRVLVVEDHVALANRIGEGLRDARFRRRRGLRRRGRPGEHDAAPTTTWSCSTATCRRVHGDRVCRTLVRDGSPSRILMLTAAADVEDRVDGLELGADDYLGKPFAFPS